MSEIQKPSEPATNESKSKKRQLFGLFKRSDEAKQIAQPITFDANMHDKSQQSFMVETEELRKTHLKVFCSYSSVDNGEYIVFSSENTELTRHFLRKEEHKEFSSKLDIHISPESKTHNPPKEKP